jgi:hypothetical protein
LASTDPCDDGTRLIAQYRALYATPAVGASPSGDAKGDVQIAFRHLVALVPDPVESRYVDYFDSALEGVQEAVAAGTDGGSYVRDHSWLPWPDQDSTLEKRRCWETHPGVLLYRPPGDPSRTPAIVVLLVGETPTWGVQEGQFETALRIVDEFKAWWPADGGGDEYRIIGPTFSGTAPSLSAVMRRHASVAIHRFSIASGTATNPTVQSTVEAAVPRAPDGGPGLAYWSATPDDNLLLDAMIDFLCERGAQCSGGDPSIALLTESLTTYGSAGSGRKQSRYIELKFPPSLAPIRNSYTIGPPGSNGASAATLPADNAPLSLGKSATELSKDTPIAHDLALGEVLRDLSARRVRFVGIVATDALDVIFLADRIRQQLPDVRLFTLSTDVRYLDPSYAHFMNGMLVAHPTPSPVGDHRPTSLQNEFVRSVFNAGRCLLANERLGVGVRISLIGNGAFWQIGSDTADESRSGGAQVPTSARLPVSWSFVFCFFAVAFCVVFLLVIAPRLGELVDKHVPSARGRVGFLRHRGALWALVGRCEHADLRADDSIVTACLITVAACPAILMFVSQVARNGDRPSWTMTALSVVVEASVLGANLTYVVLKWPSIHRPEWSTMLLAGGATVASVLALGLGCGPQREATFNLMSGGSPVVAGLIGLTILGIGLWCWRIRLRFLDTHRFGVDEHSPFEQIDPPIARALGEGVDDPRGAGPANTGLAEVERRLLHVIRSPWLSFVAVPAIVHAFFAVSILVAVGIKPPQTFERSWRNTLLVVFGCLALLPVTGNLSRMIATWIAFSRFLRRLAYAPMVSALARLPPPLARPLELQLGLSGSEVFDLVCAVEALTRVSATDPAFKEDAEKCADLLSGELRYEAGPAYGPPVDALRSGAKRAELVTRLLASSSRLSQGRDAQSEDTRALIDGFVAALVAAFIPRYVRHFRLFVLPLVMGSVLSVLMTSLYFVQPERLITSVIFVWVAAIVLAVFTVYVALDRDPIISSMGKTTAGSVTWNWAFVGRVVSWGLFPIASLFAAQYPQFTSWISTLFDAVAKGFR